MIPSYGAPEGVDGAALLDELRDAYTTYVIFPSPEAADVVTLYTAATHAQPAWPATSPGSLTLRSSRPPPRPRRPA